MTPATTGAALPGADSPDFWIEAFDRVDPVERHPVESLMLLYDAWDREWREGMTINQRQRVIVAKNRRKRELGG